MVWQMRTLVRSCAAPWVVLLGATAAVGADALRPVSPEDILNARWAVVLALSPDGSQIAYTAPQGPLTPCGGLLSPPDPNGTGPQLIIS